MKKRRRHKSKSVSLTFADTFNNIPAVSCANEDFNYKIYNKIVNNNNNHNDKYYNYSNQHNQLISTISEINDYMMHHDNVIL